MSGKAKSGRGASSPYAEPELHGGGDGGGGSSIEAREPPGRSDEGGRVSSSPPARPSPQALLPRDEGSSPAGAHQPDAAPRKQLSDYREQLVREMSARGVHTPGLGLKRPSPIQEETTMSPPAAFPEPTTASTESGNTIRGGATPGLSARTPSYPFPQMVTPGFVSSSLHRPFTTLSPTAPQPGLPMGQHESANFDRILSNPSTPASALTFHPAGSSHHGASSHPDFPTPNLYDVTLMLAAEPGLDAWWNTVVQIMTDCYKAERVTLAIPADSTDIENVPWGQKATYNSQERDNLSLGYMARGSSMVPSSTGDCPDPAPAPSDTPRPKLLLRPSLPSRHSFTSYENRKEQTSPADKLQPTPSRPNIPRSKSSYPVSSSMHEGTPAQALPPHGFLNKRALEEHDAVEGLQPRPSMASWEAPLPGQPESRGRVLQVLQGLDYEADPLIDHNGVQRVLERGKVVALTRSYPYLDPNSSEKLDDPASSARARSSSEAKKAAKKLRSDSATKLSSLLGSANLAKGGRPGDRKKASSSASRLEDEPPRPRTPKYEEYEQQPPSPWSQSPAPSPAIRADPKENPFFRDAMVDEESFDPTSAPKDYSAVRAPEAIGTDNSWTVLHVPLIHPLLSKPSPAFKLDATAIEHKSSARGKDIASAIPSPDPTSRKKPTPIAILSILSPIIPYPSNLRYSIEHLAPHLATSYSLCRHYTNLEAEVSGLHRRRPDIGGIGAVGMDGRPLASAAALTNLGYLPAEDLASHHSLAGSLTSPSDYSGPTRSATGSPAGTPSWDPSAMGLIMDKRVGTSPSQMMGESYFNARPSTSSGRPASTPGGVVIQRARRNSKDLSMSEKRSALRIAPSKVQIQEPASAGPDVAHGEPTTAEQQPGRDSLDELPTISIPQRRAPSSENKASPAEHKTEKGLEPGGQQGGADIQRKPSTPNTPGQAPHHRHSMLHSYGADFYNTFQSLPPSSTVSVKAAPQTAPQGPVPSRSASVSQIDMPPPSDRLKGLILDSLPAHVFVAMPHTGAIVWVNSRYLTYRGQTVDDLAHDPWASIHPDDKDEYLKAWGHSVRTGDQFSRTVRIRRFDGSYRWFQARAVATRDRRNSITQFLGSYMDIHDQHIAELKAARQEEIEASEAKHRLLANLIPQIIFTATEDEGITFANEQWLSYTGQSFEDALGLGFMDYVHPEDLAKCKIPTVPASAAKIVKKASDELRAYVPDEVPPVTPGARQPLLSRHSSSGSSSGAHEPGRNDLAELARKGIIKVTTDSSGRLSYTTELRLRSKKNEYRWHLIRCVQIDNIDFGTGASSYFGSATDINDHKLLEEKLKEAMDSKGRFLSNMSHEIRTPLIGISGMVSFLQDTTLNEEQRDYTNTIQTSANSLLMIINDILDLSKVDAGMMKLNFEWFHTRSLIEDVNELVSTMAIAKRLELNYVVEADVPAWVKGDKVRIRQVLLNVIGNAIKFTSEGEVFSRCRVLPQPGNDGHADEDEDQHENEIMLEFSIIDTGRGFTKEEAELIFKPFSQIDGSSTRQHGGSGLGLVISRQLVELHGGTMDGTAVPGKGSTFTFSARFGLPTDDDHPDAPLSPREASLPAPAYVEELQGSQPFTNFATRRIVQSPPIVSPTGEAERASPALASSGSSDPSIRSLRSRVTERSSMSSVNVGLARFSEAARASGQDLSQMKLEMPTGRSSPDTTPTAQLDVPLLSNEKLMDFRPPMYSILIICPQLHSREATTKHIEMTLPKDVPHQITPISSASEAQKLIGGDDPVVFTHVVINLPSPDEIIGLVDQLQKSTTLQKTHILVLSDSVQRQAVMKLAAGTRYEELLSEQRVTYIYKPVKPSRFAVIFDPGKERDLSIDRNRSTAQRIVETQKQTYVSMEKRLGGKGYKVLLVEDNPVNQKVLQKYLRKVGVEVDVAVDGVECTDKVFAHHHGYYALILVCMFLFVSYPIYFFFFQRPPGSIGVDYQCLYQPAFGIIRDD